jgi:PKD repeat protein
LKKGKQNITFEELFREKLEYAEVGPDSSVRTNLLRKLERKEFLRFNINRFNIYYIGGLIVTGIITILILKATFAAREENNPLSPPVLNQVSNINTINRPAEIRDGRVSEKSKAVLNTDPDITVADTQLNVIEEVNSEAQTRVLSTDIIRPPSIIESIAGKGNFEQSGSEMRKLQGGFQLKENLIGKSLRDGCTPLRVNFTNKSTISDSCRWSFGDGGFSTEKNPEWIYDVEGEYKVILSVYYPDGTVNISSTDIIVHPQPLARFEISLANPNQLSNELRFINYSSNAVKFKWDFGDGNTSEFFEPDYRYPKSGNYNVKLTAISDFGCKDSLVIVNAFTGNNYFINFPNAFIPNIGGPTGGFYSSTSDEGSQVFHPVFAGVSDYELKIFSKLGILVFESNDISVGWDGYFKGQLSEPGVYVWKVRGTFLSGESFIKMGDLTILKN